MATGRHNGKVGVALGAIVAGMVGLSFASVPLYRMFCAYTGFGGTPQIGGAQSASVSTAAPPRCPAKARRAPSRKEASTASTRRRRATKARSRSAFWANFTA